MKDSLPPRKPGDRTARNARHRLLWAAALVAGLTFALTALMLVARVRAHNPIDLAFIADVALGLVLGFGVAAVLCAVASLLHCSAAFESCIADLQHVSSETRASAQQISQALQALPEIPDNRPDPANQEAVAALRAAADEILLIVRDARDNTLLTEDQRREKAIRVEQQAFAEAQARVDHLSADGDFARAEQLVAELTQRYPGRPSLQQMSTLIARRREEREKADVHEFTRRIEEFINISAWERARGTADELRRRYPNSPAAGQLEARIDREFQLYEDAQRRQMYAEIERYVSRRRWNEALAAAETFIERFPHRSEADALRIQLSTLANNAEVAARQDMDAEITELARRGQYAEAESLADQLIRRWPDSPQAEILRSQLDRLHELATNPNAPPPRVRPQPG